MLIALASIYKLEIHQMDVKTAFLKGELDEEIYMQQLEGFFVQSQECVNSLSHYIDWNKLLNNGMKNLTK